MLGSSHNSGLKRLGSGYLSRPKRPGTHLRPIGCQAAHLVFGPIHTTWAPGGQATRIAPLGPCAQPKPKPILGPFKTWTIVILNYFKKY
jgi:hypothetical protein